MYSKKYSIEGIKEHGRHNPIYERFIGGYCFPAYLKIGCRGWLLCVANNSWDLTPHRLHTSIIKDIKYTEDALIIKSENTEIVLREAN